MKKIALAMAVVLACGISTAAQEQRFTVSGNIDGLEKGDTLRFRQIILPGWKDGDTFDVVLKKDSRFKYKGTQGHDMYYIMEYHPVCGSAPECDRSGKTMIIAGNDRIRLSGSRDYIYYSRLEGGVYDDPRLAECLAVEDSVGAARGDIMRRLEEANAAEDYETARKISEEFNSFYNDNHGAARPVELISEYFKDNPQGNNYILVDRLQRMSYTPLDRAKEEYDAYSPEVKQSYYGKVSADLLGRLEAIDLGRQAPYFSLTLNDGTPVSNDDFKGKYLLIYHWGMCPGSMQIDPEVQSLYSKYKNKGLCIIGITESIDEFRGFAEGIPEGTSSPSIGIDDLKARMDGMLAHPWPEAELKTGRAENQKTADTFMVSGLPYFIFIGPDGTILARDFQPAFYQAKETLLKAVGK